MFKKESGITLVALVVTIIVLLILAGVSITMVIGNNGIINRSRNAVNSYDESSKNEAIYLNETENLMKNLMGE